MKRIKTDYAYHYLFGLAVCDATILFSVVLLYVLVSGLLQKITLGKSVKLLMTNNCNKTLFDKKYTPNIRLF